MSAARRIAIIDDADRMNEASANALLKTLEEPPPGSILILISPSSDALLPTIRSRCQPVLFSALPAEDVAELIVQLEWEKDPTSAQEIARLCGGSLDTARQLLDPGLRNLRESLAAALARQPFSSVEASQQMLKTLEELGGGSSGQREHAQWMLRFGVDFLRQVLGDEAAPSPAVEGFRRAFPPDAPQAADRIVGALDRMLHAEEDLQQSMPVPLCLETLFHDLGRIFRGTLIPV